jgi:hemerythrin superfamily protein
MARTPPATEVSVTILDALKADHDDVKSLLGQILEAEETKVRIRLFSEFKTKMTAHSHSEEKVFYRRMERTEAGRPEALEGAVEHKVVERLMSDLSRKRGKASEAWSAGVRVLRELVEHHVEEEEGEFFEIARKEFDEQTLEKMAEEFAREKKRLGVGPTSNLVAAE